MKQIRVGDFKLGFREKRAINKVLDSGRLSEGAYVKEFEDKWAKFVGTKYCVATSSGFGALVVGLAGLKYYKKLQARPKVITTPLTYIADTTAISSTGFEPVFVDVDPKTFCITPRTIAKHLQQAKGIGQYGVILPVDLMGFPTEIDKINEIAAKYNVSVLEDAAQAHGSIYKGGKAGSQALLAIYSFYVAHNIQAGEMGAIVTNNLEICKLARKLKAQGRACECRVCTRDSGICPLLKRYEKESDDIDPRFIHDLIGYNFKTMEFQAALALTQLKKVKEITEKRAANVKYLNDHLEQYSDILQLPKFSKSISYLAYPIVIKEPSKISRKELRLQLEEKGIETRPLFGCIPTQQPAYSHLRAEYKNKLPNAEYLGANAFYIGCHQYLRKGDLERVVKVFDKILKDVRHVS